MNEILLGAAILLLVAAVAMLGVLLQRTARVDLWPVAARLETLEKLLERIERGVKEEIARNRQESGEQARGLREEVQGALRHSTESLVQSMDGISAAQHRRLEEFANRLSGLKEANDAAADRFRQELTGALNASKEAQERRWSDNVAQLKQHFDSFGRRLAEFGQSSQDSARQARSELSAALKDFKDSLQKQMNDQAGLQRQHSESFAAQLNALTEKNEKKSDELRAAVEGKLAQLQSENAGKLEAIRRTVDEQLQGTLDRRLGESFKLVSDRLEQVHKGLGEMQALASGVGDLKRVLTNVKTRGTWGEVTAKSGAISMQYARRTEFDCLQLQKTTTVQGSVFGPAAVLAGIEDGGENNLLDLFLAGYGAAVKREVGVDREWTGTVAGQELATVLLRQACKAPETARTAGGDAGPGGDGQPGGGGTPPPDGLTRRAGAPGRRASGWASAGAGLRVVPRQPGRGA